MNQLFPQKCALVYDWVTTPYGGAEQVLSALHEAFPEAPLFTTIASPHSKKWSAQFELHTSWLQAFHRVGHRLLSPLFPLAIESLDLSAYDCIISISSSFAKGVITRPQQLHLNYLLTPPRFIYEKTNHYTTNPLLQPLLAYWRRWDQIAAYRPDVMIPISNRVAVRAAEFYPKALLGKTIYPPHQLPHKQSQPKMSVPASFALVLSRLVSYKKIEVAIQAAEFLNIPLVIAGTGPEESQLRNYSHSNSTLFLGSVSDEERLWLLRNAITLIMPGEEDFGITAVEAAAVGTPVCLHQKSGAAEIIPQSLKYTHSVESDTAVIASLKKVLQISSQQAQKQHRYSNYMKKYDKNEFIDRFRQAVSAAWQSHSSNQGGQHAII